MIPMLTQLDYIGFLDKWYAGYRIKKGKWVNAYGKTQEEAIELLYVKLLTGSNPHGFRVNYI